MLNPVFLLSCLLLSLVSSAPLTSDSESWSASSSSSDEDLQSPAVVEAPPGVIMEVADTKTNVTLSFAIFILADEKEGSGADGGGRSDENSASSESSEEITTQHSRPMGTLVPAETEPMTEEDTKKHLLSEEMMSDQPMFTVSDDEAAASKGSNMKQKLTLSDDSDDFNNMMLNDQGYVATFDYFDDRNNSRSEFTDNTNNKETDDPTFPLSDDFNNSTESREVHSQPTVTLTDYSDDKNNSTESRELNDFDYSDDNNTRSDEPTSRLSNDFSNSSSSEVFNLNPNLQGVTLNPDTQSSGGNQQGAFDVNAALDPESQEVTSSSSEKSQDRVGSSLQEVFRSIQEIVDLLSGNKGPTGVKGRHHEVLGLTSFTGSQMDFSLSSDESNESSESDPKNQTSVSSGPDSDESLEATSSNTQKGTGPRDSTGPVTGPTASSVSAVIHPDPDSKEVPDTSAGSTQADKRGILNLASSDQGVAPMIWSMLKNTVSQQSTGSFSQVGVSLNPSSSEESQESVGTKEVVGSGPVPKGGGPEVRSSSEEFQLALSSVSSPITSPQTPTVPESLSSESDESDSSGHGPGSQGADSGFQSRSTDPTLTSNSSSISQEESEESPTIKVPTDANSDASREANPIVDSSTNTASIAASSEASVDANPVSGVKDADADLSAEATIDSSYDVSIDTDPTDASVHASSGATTDADTDTGSELRTEEDNNVSTEAISDSVSIKPAATAKYSTNPSDSRANTDAIADLEKEQAGTEVSTEANPNANRLSPNQYARSEENMASPPRRKRPYRFGFLGPISHFYSNQPVARETIVVRHHPNDEQHHQQQVSRQTDRKLTRISVATAGNLAKSSSEETNQ
ncbi:dentin sialophosphoprotein-like [Thunnus thynnus]|uniref:dentin sialophosphoprotein-like n=1 Tax=Thunnus thynnus TaxID=8237 RepID=UPI0035283697